MIKDDLISLTPGSEFLYNGKICKIKSALSLDSVLLVEVNTGESYAAKIIELKLVNETHDTLSCRVETSLITDEEWEKAKKREIVIKSLAINCCSREEAKSAGEKLGLSSRQIYKLINRYRKGGCQLKSLIPSKKSGGKDKSRLPNDVEAIIQSVIKDKYLSKQKIKISLVIEEVRRLCFYVNMKPPSGNAIRKRIQQLSMQEVTKKRHGNNETRKLQPIIGVSPVPDHPLAILQIDHTPVDLIIVDEIYRKSIGRPYLTVAIDVYSRCITGFCLTLEPPSAISAALCLTHSVFEKEKWLSDRKIETEWPIWGIPNLIYVDNAKEFHSEALQRGCDAHGITIDYRPLGQPHYGGIVERVIGTLMQLIHQLPGTTFSNIAERGEYPSEQKAVLTMIELEHWLTIAITDYYHRKIHSGINFAPIEKYKMGILGNETHTGYGHFPRIENQKKFLLDFLPIERRTLQRHGFMLDHLSYYSNSLSPLIANRKKYGKFIIRRDPRDISLIYVLDPESNTYLNVPYRTLSRPTITLWEHRQALKFLREKGLEQTDESLIFQAIEKMRSITKEAMSKSKSARRSHERTQIANQNINTKNNFEESNSADDSTNNKPIKIFENIELW